MRSFFSGLVVCALAALGFVVRSAPAAADPGLRRPLPFAIGERLEFSLQYGPVKAGTGTLIVSGVGRVGTTPCYHFISLSRSVPFFDNIYPVRDLVETYADTAALVTRRFEKHLREGSYKLDSVVHVEPGRGTAVYQDGDRYPVGPDMRDALAAFYWVRTQPLAVGQTFTIPSHGDRKSYDIVVHVARRETVKTPAGTFHCLVVEPALKSTGVFRQMGGMTIWLTDDGRKMPVKLSSKVAVGSIVGVLTSATGLEGVGAAGGPRLHGAAGGGVARALP